MSDQYGEGTEHLRREHGELLPHIKGLRRVANANGTAPVDHVRQEVERIHEFIKQQLIPHAMAEDQVLYPAVGRVLGSRLATATMSRDHVAIRDLTEELRELQSQMGGPELPEILMVKLRRFCTGCTRFCGPTSPRSRRSTSRSWMRRCQEQLPGSSSPRWSTRPD